ncbi:MAG: hypothetical protein FJZ58_00375 [Chlamydiae bacterium]|nr:hypothetical protein [Chlamydiota bacterium]
MIGRCNPFSCFSWESQSPKEERSVRSYFSLFSACTSVAEQVQPTKPESYQQLVRRFQDASQEWEIRELFHDVKDVLDLYRYRGVHEVKKEIEVLMTLIGRRDLREDIHCIIDRIESLFSSLQIFYHDTQHTLEVMLGVARVSVIAYQKGKINNVMWVFLGIVAALCHDIGYCNQKEIINLVGRLSKESYDLFFTKAKGRDFVSSFELLQRKIQEGSILTGGELHLYHVYLGQITMRWILQDLPLQNKDWLLTERSLETMGAMISLTDISASSLSYRQDRKAFLLEQGMGLLGDILSTSDLLTQLATSDRLSKGLALYHEFVKGEDDARFVSGFHLLATVTDFYEGFAKSCLSQEVLNLFQEFFTQRGGGNSYQETLSKVLALHALFESIYTKYIHREKLSAKDLLILKGLEENGLPSLIGDFFYALTALQEGKSSQDEIDRLLSVLQHKGSVEEVSMGDEIRLLLAKYAHVIPRKDAVSKNWISELYKPRIITVRGWELSLLSSTIDRTRSLFSNITLDELG